ncbi:MAG TPA: FAD-binding oxidoreductase [Candidatus Saccharimonadaceae bacterium]|nr:FAD-binding oxidoreductase [Candidatus Saccharimonadaceae bacterium]
MNKIATYLNEHLLGEATSSKAMRRRFSRDNSILTMTPEIVVFPRVTNDIRKVARFTWQLAEKGHPMGVTARGMGADCTGAAIGKGIVLDTSAHLSDVLTVVAKERLVHVQPGVRVDVLDNLLRWQGLAVAGLPGDSCHATVGGTVANNSIGSSAAFADSVEKLEVVLANGDIIETGRISKHEVSKKLGLQTFEGEVYRKVSGLIEGNDELIKQMVSDATRDNTGYRSIAAVKAKDGSMDLTPLFTGSQGTLGIISEIVLRTDFYSQDAAAAVVLTKTAEQARDVADKVVGLSPSLLYLIDDELINRAHSYGKVFGILGTEEANGSVVYVEFNDIGDRARQHKIKKLRKLMKKLELGMVDSVDRDIQEFRQLLDAPEATRRMADDDKVTLPIIDGAFVPFDRREEFHAQLQELADKQHIELPLKTNLLTGTLDVYPQLKLDVVSDKQKIFRLITAYADLVHRCNGAFVSDGAEGRLKANAAWSVLDDAEVKLFEEVRAIFDPFGTMNPGVKQKNEVRALVSSLRSQYDTTDFVS